MTYTDLTDKRFGKLVVVGEAGRTRNSTVYWECLCDCGGKTVVPTNELNRGQQSCGCVRGKADKLGEKNSQHRLTESAVLEIRKSALPPRALAEQFNVSPSTVYAVLSRQNWQHI